MMGWSWNRDQWLKKIASRAKPCADSSRYGVSARTMHAAHADSGNDDSMCVPGGSLSQTQWSSSGHTQHPATQTGPHVGGEHETFGTEWRSIFIIRNACVTLTCRCRGVPKRAQGPSLSAVADPDRNWTASSPPPVFVLNKQRKRFSFVKNAPCQKRPQHLHTDR